MRNQIIIFRRSYSGESLSDLDRDMTEAFDPRFNDLAKGIELDEYSIPTGTFTVTISYAKDTP